MMSIQRGLSYVAGVSLVILGACDDDEGEPTPTEDPKTVNEFSYAGDFASWLLTSSPYSSLAIEVDVMEGALPTSDAEDAFQEALDTLVVSIDFLCYKPGGVTLLELGTVPASTTDTEFTLEEVKALESTYRDTYWTGDTMSLYFLYLNGHSDYDDPEAGTAVVGYAYRGSSMAIFMETVNSKPVPLRPGLLKTVTVHEFGHQIGLVDNGVAMQTDHDDPDHPPHCNNESCMMYWINNGTSLLETLLSNDIPDFDDACLADVAAAGGRDGRNLEQPN